jgi:hypothetical protein
MAMNRTQFQRGICLPEFLRGFETEAACARALMAARWPNGFSCPGCGEQAHCVISVSSTLAGASHAFDYRKYADRYLAGFAYRFNRRFDLHTLVIRLIVAVARSAPRPEHVIRQEFR